MRWPKESSLSMWGELFAPIMPVFLSKFPRYIEVDISSQSGETNHRRWFSWCESRLRQLIKGIELPNAIFCHPISSCYQRKLYSVNIMQHHLDNDASNSISNMQTVYHEEESVNAFGADSCSPPEIKYVTTYLMGLTFCNGIKSVDLTATLQVCMKFLYVLFSIILLL